MKYNTLLKTSGLLFLLVNALLLDAQLRHLGYPISGKESNYDSRSAACNSGTDLWVVIQTYDSAVNNYNFKLCKHNGLYWTEYFKFTGAPGPYTDMNACFYNGDLYFNASFNNLVLNSVSYPRMNAVLKWDGTSVSFIDSVKGYIRDMDTFMNQLIIAGDFNKVGTNNIGKLARYNGSTWSALGNPADWVNFQPGSGNQTSSYIPGNTQVVNQGDKLYITGNYIITDSTKPRFYGLAVYDGSTISPVSPSEFSDNSLVQYLEIYAHPDSSVYYTNDSTFKTLYCQSGQTRTVMNRSKSNYFFIPGVSHAFAYRNGSVYTLKGMPGPVWGTKAFIEKLTGRNLQRIYLPSRVLYDVYRSFGIFGKEAVFMMLGQQGNQAYYMLDSNENITTSISGKVFHDIDGDSVYTWVDKPLKNVWVKLKQANAVALTDINGEYNFHVESGWDTVEVIKPDIRKYKFPSSGKHIDSIVLNTSYTRDFALMYDSTIKDLGLEISSYLGWRARRGFSENYTLTIRNNSAYVRSGTVYLTLDSVFNYPVSYDTALVFNGRFASYTFTDLKPEQSLRVRFSLRTNFSSTLGQKYRIMAVFDSTSLNWDNRSENNKDTLKVILVASCDPNDKNSLPSGDIYPGARKIQYHINFQNVGNDTAYQIVIVDTIDLRIPLESIILGSYSHPYKLRIKDNILIFEFNNIKLVDSATNEEGSKGFIRFSAQLNGNLPVLTKINNRAYIYFDYNEAVITNVASVRLVDRIDNILEFIAEENSLSVYPNPGNGKLTVVNKTEQQLYQLFNASGVLVKSGELMNGDNRLELSNLSAGIYLLCLQNGTSVKFIIQ